MCLVECGMNWLRHCMKRKSLRDKFNLREDPSYGGCVTTFCCGPCALCQEAHFLEANLIFFYYLYLYLVGQKVFITPYVIQPTAYNVKY
ncbi:unnamed protein product [Adineta steineri]|uniref:Uncharacterized protein n=1 Tax=Adineta steineri TaxID=433720 RepID=A0A820KMN2_9BILA|nr:unnamed protein product [Adineta steineri]